MPSSQSRSRVRPPSLEIKGKIEMIARICCTAIFISLFLCNPLQSWAEESVTSGSPHAQAATVKSAPQLNGFWSGVWTSKETGHRGPISANFNQIDACHYEVRFHGRFLKIIPFAYKAVLTATGTSGDRVYLSASKRLGPLLGTFTISGWATHNQFVASYSSKDDAGQFCMTRR